MSEVFVLTDENGQLLSPIRQAATFAKYSRAPESARELAKQTTELGAEKFQTKWLVNFGHSSIAELATLPVAFEGVSFIASKAIEAWQRPGVAEKSTRMQKFDRASLYVPDGIEDQWLSQLLPLAHDCLALYERLVVDQDLREVLGRERGVDGKALDREVFDVVRYLLPAGCRTNLGICACPRDISDMIATFTGSPNPELRTIGAQLAEATSSLGGPLIRHTEPNAWVNEVPEAKPAMFVPYIVSHTETEFWVWLKAAYGWSSIDLAEYMNRRPERHPAPKLFRYMTMRYYTTIDYGAYRDLQRHRRMEQYTGLLTNELGYSMPPGSKCNCMVRSRIRRVLEQFRRVSWPTDPVQRILCQYLVPLAFRLPWYIKMDLEQLYYLVELRTQEAGHESYRRVAFEMMDFAAQEWPFLTQWIRPRGPRPEGAWQTPT